MAVRALTAILLGYMGDMFMSGDRAWLAMHAGEKIARRAGIPKEDFDRVARAVSGKQAEMRSGLWAVRTGFIG